MTLPDDDDPQPPDQSTRRGYAAWLQSQTDRAKRNLKYMRNSVAEASRLGQRPENIPVGYIASDPLNEGRRGHIVKASTSTLVPNAASSSGADGSGPQPSSSSAIWRPHGGVFVRATSNATFSHM
eukprot:8456604-Karenia_brevis.AAC.1